MYRLLASVLFLAFVAWPAVNSEASEVPEQATLLVLPVAAPAGQYSWVGSALQQDMAVDLTHLTRARVISPSAPVARDQAEALRAAREAGAQYVVHAAAQVSGNQLRVSGQLTEVATAKVLSPIDATAPLDDLFPLEDALAVQVARGLPASLATFAAPPTQPAASPPAEAPVAAAAPEGPPQYESIQTPAPYYYVASAPGGYYAYPYAYPYYYGYPYFGAYWGYGWWGPGVVIVHHGWGGYHGWYGYGGHGWAGHGPGGAHFEGGHMGGGHGGGGGMHGR